jgi:hypothetical protein
LISARIQVGDARVRSGRINGTKQRWLHLHLFGM